MTFSNLLPKRTPEEEREHLRASVTRAVEQVKRARDEWHPAPVEHILSPEVWKLMRAEVWIDENGRYTEAFYRGY